MQSLHHMQVKVQIRSEQLKLESQGEDCVPNVYTSVSCHSHEEGERANSLIWPDAANGSLDQNAGYWLYYHGRITGIIENAEVSGLVWVKQNLVVSQGWGVSECRRGRIVGLVLRDRERESEGERGSSHSHQRQ